MRSTPRSASSGTILAPAKINTFLSVGPRDSRGYHPLRTIFQAVSLFDEIEVSLGGENNVEFDVPGIPARNTVTRAIELYGRETETPPVSVLVQKRIPTESGLGGGSSDAAAVLRALQKLLGSPLPDEALQRIALEVGSDVPFFLVGGRARAEGYGEKLTSLPDGPEQWLVLAQPEERCSTGEMFRKLDQLQYDWHEFPPDPQKAYNDFERVAPCACLDLIERMQVLGAFSAGLSGSGSAVFGLFDSPEAASKIERKIKEEGIPWAVNVRTLSRLETLS